MSDLIQFVMGNSALLAALGIAILDLVFALNKDWKSNGVLHFIYVQLSQLKNKVLPSPQG